MTRYLAVGLGSALGGTLRWLLSDTLQVAGHVAEAGFPWSTLWINASGSLLIGFYAARLVAKSGQAGERREAAPSWRGTPGRLFFMTGFCGGYTTFSVFSLETVFMLQAGRAGLAAVYVTASVILWLAAAWAGYTIGRQRRQRRQRRQGR